MVSKLEIPARSSLWTTTQLNLIRTLHPLLYHGRYLTIFFYGAGELAKISNSDEHKNKAHVAVSSTLCHLCQKKCLGVYGVEAKRFPPVFRGILQLRTTGITFICNNAVKRIVNFATSVTYYGLATYGMSWQIQMCTLNASTLNYVKGVTCKGLAINVYVTY